MDLLALVSDFVRRHLVWAPLIAFAVAFLESLPFVGLFVPGTSMLLGLGAAVALAGGSVFPVVVAAALGAVLGAWISYGVGCRYGEAITRHPFLQRRPRIIGACQSLFHRHGMMSVAIARFLPVVRPMAPMVAGAFGLEARRFHLVNVVSVLAWAPAFILPGALTGMAAGALGGRATATLLGLLAIAGAAIWLLLRLRPAWARWTSALRAARRTWLDKVSGGPGWLVALARLGLCPSHARLRSMTTGLGVFALLTLHVFNLADDVQSRRPILQADQAVINLLATLQSPGLDRLAGALVLLGDAGAQLTTMALALVVLNHRRRYHAMAALVVGMALVAVLAPAIGAILDVSRPDSLLSSSFPNRPAALAACLALTLAGLFTPRAWSVLRMPMAGLAAAGALGVGWALIYRGGAWPSHVIAGLSLGAACAALALPLAAAEPKARRLALFHPSWALGAALALTVVLALPTVMIQADPSRTGPAAHKIAVQDVVGLGEALPDRRIDLVGQAEEPFSALWIGDPARLEAALRREGWSTAPGWRPRATLGFLNATSDIRHLPAAPVLHEGRAAVLTLSRPGAGAHAREVLRLWPTDVRVGQEMRPVYVGSLTRESAARPARLLVALRQHDEASLHDATLARLAPMDPAAWGIARSSGRAG